MLVFAYFKACIFHIPQYYNLVRGHSIKQLPLTSPELCTPLVVATTDLMFRKIF